MISMLCQKSNSGVISSENQDLFNMAIRNENYKNTSLSAKLSKRANLNENQKINEKVLKKKSSVNFELENLTLDSNFLKRFSTPLKVNFILSILVEQNFDFFVLNLKLGCKHKKK